MEDRRKQVVARGERSGGSMFRKLISLPSVVAARVKNRGRIFVCGENCGPGGGTRLRFNFAMPRQILEEALGRLDDAIKDLRMGK